MTLPQPEASGTLVDLGNTDNKETTTNLSEGGSARYNASGIIARTRWLGTQGCSSPNRHNTTNQFLFRVTTNHDGGCISGMSMYGNLTPHDDYDPGGDPGNFALYPCSDGGQFYGSNNFNLNNFTIQNVRAHSCWDPIRVPGRVNATTITAAIEDSWFTCIRDDCIENDGGNEISIRRVLVGDTIGQNSGCWVFLSMTSGADRTDREVIIEDCLIWSHRMRATSRTRLTTWNGVGGYACGAIFKINSGSCPRIRMRRCIIMSDQYTISGGNGNPLHQLLVGGPVLIESTSNVLIFRDLGGAGTGNIVLPPGFTLITGAAGEAHWNSAVAEWKQDHPNVRRFNITGIARPFGGTTSVVDQG